MLHPATATASVVTAAITVPSRRSCAVACSSARWMSKLNVSASGASDGSNHVLRESAFTANAVDATRVDLVPDISTAASSHNDSTCRASRSSTAPAAVTRTGLLRTTTT